MVKPDKDNIRFKFKVLAPEEKNNTTFYSFGCNLFLGVSHRLFKLIFEKSVTELKKKNKKAPEEIITDKFYVPQKYYKVIKTAVQKPFKDVIKQVGLQGIGVFEWDVYGAVFEKEQGVWIITVVVKGLCEDQRK